MSGIIGHCFAAICAAKAAEARKLAISPLLMQHWSSYLCGAYLGCDIQTLPEAICVDTGEEIGYGTVPLQKSPITGGKVKPWTFELAGRTYSAREVHTLFYGRAHLVFGWSAGERQHTVPWDHLVDYVAMTFEDALEFYSPGRRQLAYLFGWLAHIVSDSLIKSVRPGLSMRLLDGLYTSRNRPVQDLVSYHELGRKQLGIDWPATLFDLSETPIEPIQLHFMRVTRPRGALYAHFSNAWAPEHEPLMRHVLAENRRYLRKYLDQLLPDYQLTMQNGQETCSSALSQQAGGLTYQEMVREANNAGLAATVGRVANEICNLFTQVLDRVPELKTLLASESPDWADLQRRWHVPPLNR